jgi:CRP/FNR family cyclic AMP-dependent transcriptional regulator
LFTIANEFTDPRPATTTIDSLVSLQVGIPMSALSHAALDNCNGCKVRGKSAFCALSEKALNAIDEMSCPVTYPDHATLIAAEQPCQAVFVLCSGRAKVSTAVRDGKKVMLRVAGSGEVLGLSSVLAGKHYKVTAETMSPAVVRILKRDDFLKFLRDHAETSAFVLESLAREYENALDSLRSLAWFPTAAARVAQLLLHMCEEPRDSQHEARAKMSLTQEQIAEMTATSRETVTRLFTQLRREQIITLRGSDLIIRNRPALERLAC